MNFLTFSYTDVFGLTPALVGTLFIALRVFDAISDPVMGVIADRTQSPLGALSSVAVMDCHSHRHYRHPDIHRARCQHGSKNRLGVRYHLLLSVGYTSGIEGTYPALLSTCLPVS